MKKLIYLFLTVFTAITYGQADFPEGIQISAGQPTVTSVNFLTTTDNTLSGLQGKIAPINLPIPYAPVNYSISNQSIGQHLTGIDTRLGQISSTTAGITQRVYFTADNTTVNAVTYFATSLTGKGSTATGSPPALVLADNTKAFFTKDLISIAQPANTIGYAGTYSGQLTVSASPAPAQQRFTVEIYRTNNLGVPISSGVSGAPTGDLGVTVIAILDSGLINLASGSITNVQVSGILTQNITINTGERLRYHVSAAKVGAGGGNVTFGVYYGSSYNSYYDVPVAITTDAVLNKSTVTGVTATDALNTLNTNRITGAFISGRIPYSNSTNSLTDSSRLLWDNTNSILNVNGTKPVISLKENLNNKTIEFTTQGSGGNSLIIQQTGGKKRLTLEGENALGSGEPKLGIGNFTGSIPLETQLYVYGGESGANIDARGSAIVDEANIDLEGNDWPTSANGLGFSYFGSLRTGLPTIFGYNKTRLGQIRFGNVDTALITSINPTSTVTPIRFGINTAEISFLDDKGFSYKSDFASINASNNRWLTDKGYVDAGLSTKQNSLTNPITGTGTRTASYMPVFSGTNTISNGRIYDSGVGMSFGGSTVFGGYEFLIPAIGNNSIYLGVADGVKNPRAYISHQTTSSTQNIVFGSAFSSGSTMANWYFESGNVGVNALSGTGIRNVAADASGNLVISNVDSRPYKVYTALLTQTGTSAPVATVLENNTGYTISYAYGTTGTFSLTSSTSLPLDKTAIFITNGGDTTNAVMSAVYASGTVTIRTVNQATNILANSLLLKTTIEIRIYP